MNKIALVTVLSEKDVELLPRFIESAAEKRFALVILVHNPHLGCDVPTSEDVRLPQLRGDITAAMAREDFDAAKRFKEQRDTILLEAVTLRDAGWKKLAPAELAKRHESLFGPMNLASASENAPLRVMLKEAVDPKDGLKGIFHALSRAAEVLPAGIKYPGIAVFSPSAFLDRTTDTPAASTAPATESSVPVAAPAPRPVAPVAAKLSVTAGHPSIGAAKFTALTKGECVDILRQLSFLPPPEMTLAQCKVKIREYGVVLPPQAPGAHFAKKAA